MSDLRHLRTRVDPNTYDALAGAAALAGVSLAEHIRTVLVKSTKGAPRDTMTEDQKRAWNAWLNACTDDADKAGWCARVDRELRNRGHDLPPITDRVAWARAVHPHTRAANGKVDAP